MEGGKGLGGEVKDGGGRDGDVMKREGQEVFRALARAVHWTPTVCKYRT